MTENAQPEIVEVPEATTAVVRGTVAMSDLADFFDSSFGVLREVLTKQGVAPRPVRRSRSTTACPTSR